MPRQVALPRAAIFTLAAGKWLRARVRPHVPRQVALPRAAIVTLAAGKWLGARMRPHVRRQCALLRAAIVTLAAGKRLGARMRPHVPRQVALVRAAIVTLAAGKWLGNSQHPRVILDLDSFDTGYNHRQLALGLHRVLNQDVSCHTYARHTSTTGATISTTEHLVTALNKLQYKIRC